MVGTEPNSREFNSSDLFTLRRERPKSRDPIQYLVESETKDLESSAHRSPSPGQTPITWWMVSQARAGQYLHVTGSHVTERGSATDSVRKGPWAGTVGGKVWLMRRSQPGVEEGTPGRGRAAPLRKARGRGQETRSRLGRNPEMQGFLSQEGNLGFTLNFMTSH